MRFDEQKKLIKKALLLVEELAKFEKKDVIENEERIESLIKKAHSLTKSMYWKL